jgi:hypothetical protein
VARIEAGTRVRFLWPDGFISSATGTVDHVSGNSALVRWDPPAQPSLTHVPDVSWLEVAS